jgi:phospholipid transport system substrate-binding protein
MSVAGLVRHVDAEIPLAAAEATRFIRQAGDRLVAIVTGPGSLPEKRRLMYLLVSERVDVYGIARFALGRFWNAATDRQRDKYVRIFPAILVAEIGLTRADYRVMSFSIDRCTQLDGEFQVWTTVLLPGIPPRHVGWNVGRIGGTAKIVDVIADSVSLRITQRDEYASFLAHNNDDIEALIAMLRQQAEPTS